MKYVVFQTETEAEEYRVRLQAYHDAGQNQDTTKPIIINCVIKTWRGEYALSLLNDTWPDVGNGIVVDSIEDPRTKFLVEIVEHLEVTEAGGSIDPVSRSSCIDAYVRLCSMTGDEPIVHYITSPSTGKLYKINFANPEGFLAQLIQPLVIQHNSQWLCALLSTLNNCINDSAIQPQAKFNILNVENGLLRRAIITDLPVDSLDLGREFCTIRRALVLDAIHDSSKYFSTQDVSTNKPILLSLHRLYVDTERDIYLHLNLREAVIAFYDGVLIATRQQKDILADVFHSAIAANHRAILLTTEAMREKLDLYRESLDDDQFKHLDRAIEYGGEQNDGNIRDVIIQLANATFRGIDPRELNTEIQFVLPFGMHDGITEDNRDCSFTNGLRFHVLFQRIKSSYEDPTITYLANIGTEEIGGLPSDFLSDVNPNQKVGSTLVIMKLDGCAALDFDVSGDGVIKEKPFDDEKAIRGGQYFPHKELAVNLLRTLYREASPNFPIECELGQLHVNAFSNFIVDYRWKGFGNLIIYRKAYLLTSRDAFLQAHIKYGDQIGELYRRDKQVSIKALVDNSIIRTNESLRAFVYKVIELTVKEYIERHSCWKFLWEGNPSSPKSEPNAHPIVNAFLRTVLEMKGIRVSREPRMANGAVDFFCSYTTKRNDVLKVCIEVKNAHGDGLESGISKQLPAYMEAEQTRHGIYLVLWYKGTDWPPPKKFDTIDEMNARLESIKPNTNHYIHLMSVNCTKPTPPSK